MLDVPMPPAVARLPKDKHGRPVPWFVAWIDGQPDHRIAIHARVAVAVQERRCWVCGGHIAGNLAFPLGPMCIINLTTSEPPSHLACATYSVQACPFLTTPRMRRREAGKPDAVVDPPGQMLTRNPGVIAVWVTKSYRLERVPGGVLFTVGSPARVEWYAEGRPATRAEVLASIESGLPALREVAETEGPDAVAELERLTAAAMRLVPVEAVG